jgi:RNA-directed DNA polymerase
MPEKERDGVNEYASGLLEEILHRDNMNLAYKRVKANKGSLGVDGMTVNELLQYLKQWQPTQAINNGRGL